MDKPDQKAGTRLVIVADDFGRKHSINRAVSEAWEMGMITSASLMAGEDGFAEGSKIVLHHPGLSVGLHLTLCDGLPVLPPHRIPDLVTRRGTFRRTPFPLSFTVLSRRVLRQMEDEIKAQFDRLEDSGIHPVYVDGHHHLHVHPVIFKAVCKEASIRHIRWIRLPVEPFRMPLITAPHRLPEWLVLRTISVYDRQMVKAFGMHTAHRVFGLSRTGRMDDRHLGRVLGRLATGTNEIFFHPDKGSVKGRAEMNAISSLRFRRRLVSLGIELTSYERLNQEERLARSDRRRE